MNSRIKSIRKSKELNQQQFAEQLGISRSHLAGLESGAKNLTERLTNDICRVFNVNKHWFESGEGEMFNDPLEGIVIDDEIKKMVLMYNKLDDNTKKTIINFMASALKND